MYDFITDLNQGINSSNIIEQFLRLFPINKALRPFRQM